MGISLRTTDDPMMEVNMTPLVDVMLVLLVMFIITIPIQTHAVKLDLPGKRDVPVAIHPLKNMVVITHDGRILWNGSAVTLAQLATTLGAMQQMSAAPELHLQPEPTARYEVVDQVLAITKHARVQRMGFVGNERFASF